MCIVRNVLYVVLALFISTSAMAATLVVNDSSDINDINPGNGICETALGSSICTLRAAITEANTLPGSDDITVPAGTYTLSMVGADEDLNNSGDLDVTNTLTINGAGQNTTIIDANKIDRIFDVIFGALTLNSLTVKNGLRSGDVTDATSVGGGVNVGNNTLIINNVAISNNEAGLDGGGIYSNQGNIHINESLIELNTAASRGSGVAIYGENGNIGSTNLDVTNSIIRNNTRIGVYCSRCTTSISGSYISSNEHGGYHGYLTIATVTGSTFFNNISNSRGGAIYLYSSNLMIVNSTLSGNSAVGYGGGIYAESSDIAMFNSTVVNNAASLGAAIALETVSTFQVANSIIANNTANTASSFKEIYGSAVNSLGYNLFEFTLSPNETDINADPLLMPLSDNGGNTPTHLPLPGSPVIDGGNVSGCMVDTAVLMTDQRNIARPLDGNNDAVNRCDIGAVESAFTYGIIIDKIDGLVTSELGVQAIFRVRLNAIPTAEVILPLNSSNTNEGTLSTTELVFDSQNWDQWQLVTITGVDDLAQDGVIGYSIVTGQATSLDVNFNQTDPVDLSVQNYDDESSQLQFSETEIATVEGGGRTNITIGLLGPPTDTVQVTLAISDITEGAFPTGVPLPGGGTNDGSYIILEFSPENWQQTQGVAIYPFADNTVDGDISYNITVTVTSDDPSYNNEVVAPLSVTNADSDSSSPPSSTNPTSSGGGSVDSLMLAVMLIFWLLLMVRRKEKHQCKCSC